MKCFKNLTFTNFLVVSLLVIMTIVSVYGILTFDEMSFWSKFACAFMIVASMFTVFWLFYDACREKDKNNDDKPLEKVYRLRHYQNFFSMSLVAIFLIGVLLTTMIEFDFGKVDATDFYTAFIALCTTFVVGFQIYSSIDINKKIDKLDEGKRQIEKQIEELNDLNKRCEYFNAYSIGTIRYNEASMKTVEEAEYSKRYCWNAFRAYCNALRLAAEGGQNFQEAWDSFGATKMIMCLDELTKIHETNTFDENSGGKASVMPSYDDRVRYVSDIIMYMGQAKKAVDDSKHISHKNKVSFGNLVNRWDEFKTKYYPEIK